MHALVAHIGFSVWAVARKVLLFCIWECVQTKTSRACIFSLYMEAIASWSVNGQLSVCALGDASASRVSMSVCSANEIKFLKYSNHSCDVMFVFTRLFRLWFARTLLVISRIYMQTNRLCLQKKNEHISVINVGSEICTCNSIE